MRRKQLNNRLALVFLMLTFGVALFEVLVWVLAALNMLPPVLVSKTSLPIFNIFLALISAALYVRSRNAMLHPLSHPIREEAQQNARLRHLLRTGVSRTPQNKMMISHYANEMSPYLTGLLFVLSLGEVCLGPYVIAIVPFPVFYVAVKTLRVYSQLTFGNDVT